MSISHVDTSYILAQCGRLSTGRAQQDQDASSLPSCAWSFEMNQFIWRSFFITKRLTSVSHPFPPPPSPPRLTVTRLTTLTGPEVLEKKKNLRCGAVLPSLRKAVKMHTNITVVRLVYTK